MDGALEREREEVLVSVSVLSLDVVLEFPFWLVGALGISSSSSDPVDSVSVSLKGEEGKTFDRSIAQRRGREFLNLDEGGGIIRLAAGTR